MVSSSLLSCASCSSTIISFSSSQRRSTNVNVKQQSKRMPALSSPSLVTEGTFTLSNLGMFRVVDRFDAILPRGQGFEKMQSFSNYTLSPSPLVFNSTHLLKSGFCNSLKRASVSQFPLINYDDFSNFRYSVSLRENNGGLFNSLKRVSKFHYGIRKNSGVLSVSCGVGSQLINDDDGFYMRRAVELAIKATGHTSPNPMVGCVIVKDGTIVGEGFHPKAGQPHAEVFALRDAGDLAENATAYVSLEPCNHYGRTPPCSEALIKAKVKKVVIGMVDPNPIVASRGVDKLRDAGIEVTVGVEEELCKKLNEAYIHQMLTGKPFLTLRYSLTINGCVLNQLGETATESGGYYSKLLQQYDAIIRSPTLTTPNNPFLVSKELGANQPLQIIISKDHTLLIGISDDYTTKASTNIIIFTSNKRSSESETARHGIETVVLENINVEPILEYCKSRGLCSVLIDLRGNVSDLEDLIKQLIDRNLVQKVVVEMLPIWEVKKKHEDSTSLFNHLGKRLRLKNLISSNSGVNVVMEGYF